MIFNSIEFLIFSLLFFLLWPIFRKKSNNRWTFITIASFFFYGWWDWRFLFLIIASGLIDFYCGLRIIKKPKHKKTFLIFSILGNIGSLSIFKYSAFFATVFEDFFSLFGLNIDLVSRIPEFALILPIGISFYTFQSLSYTLDIYKGKLKPTKNLLHFFSYLSMFPQLVAGPIVRAKDFLKQLNTYKIPDALQKWNAIKLICFGLFQKMVIADNLSYFVDSAFEGKSNFDGSPFWWVVMIAFSFQIYADFSGYSLIARGLAKYMGYHFKMNFNHPYLSRSLREFWTRWHISLSTWFRDYIYIPMGGSRRGKTWGMFALTTTMLLSGLWHGANYTFLVWASIHIFWLLIERLTKWTKLFKGNSFLLIPIIFIQVLIGWVYFRANDLQQGNVVLVKLFNFKASEIGFLNIYFNNIFFLVIAILIEFSIYMRKSFNSVSVFYKKYNFDIILVAISIICIIFLRGEGQQFIYFQF